MNASFIDCCAVPLHYITHSFCPATLNGVLGSCLQKSKFYRGVPEPPLPTPLILLHNVVLRFEYRSRECLFHALDCSMHLLGEIAVLLGVYKLRILVVRDCLTDVSTILVFVCKNRVILAEFQHHRWLTSFNYNHTPHAGTLPSTSHC